MKYRFYLIILFLLFLFISSPVYSLSCNKYSVGQSWISNNQSCTCESTYDFNSNNYQYISNCFNLNFKYDDLIDLSKNNCSNKKQLISEKLDLYNSLAQANSNSQKYLIKQKMNYLGKKINFYICSDAINVSEIPKNINLSKFKSKLDLENFNNCVNKSIVSNHSEDYAHISCKTKLNLQEYFIQKNLDNLNTQLSVIDFQIKNQDPKIYSFMFSYLSSSDSLKIKLLQDNNIILLQNTYFKLNKDIILAEKLIDEVNLTDMESSNKLKVISNLNQQIADLKMITAKLEDTNQTSIEMKKNISLARSEDINFKRNVFLDELFKNKFVLSNLVDKYFVGRAFYSDIKSKIDKFGMNINKINLTIDNDQSLIQELNEYLSIKQEIIYYAQVN